MKIKSTHFKRLYFAVAILLGLAALVIIIINQSDDFSGTENQSETPIEITKNQMIFDKSPILPQMSHEKEASRAAEKRKDLDTLENENFEPPLTSEGYLKTEDILEGVGLSEKGLKALHANQRQEIEQMHMDMDSVVIDPAEEGGKGIALGELLALHEQQNQAIANADDLDEIVIPALKGGYPGLTRTDLIELHKQQRLAIENTQDWDQIVIPDSEDGYSAHTWDEVATLQELQADELLEKAIDPYDLAAPYPEDGGPDMTVQELKNLHMKQSVN